MQTKTFLAGWISYLVVTFALGYVWHLVAFKDLYARLAIFTRLDDPIVPLGFTAMVIQGAVMSYLFPLLSKPNKSVVSNGLRFGLVTGLFIASSAVLAEAAKMKVTSISMWLFVETIYYAIQFALCGIAMAYSYAVTRK